MDIAEWLASLGLERYADTIRDAEVTDDVLPDLTEEDLEKLGLPLGARKKLLRAIASLGSGHQSAPAVVVGPPLRSASRLGDAERRQLTVMFIDLVGSTALSAKLDPEDMREVIRAYQNVVAGEITRFEGHIAKFMGDGVLAYFGWPRAHEDEAERAVRAGLSVIQTMGKLHSPDGRLLQARIGIATGLVVVGDLVGEGAAQEQAVVGDTPNLAARLQGAAEPGAVVIAETTRRLLGDVFTLHDLGAQVLKGIEGPTPAYAVLGERALESRFAGRHGAVAGPIVGRDQELGLLLERWRQARAGEGQVVLLTGEAGIGKSRITEALVESLAGEPHFLLRYQCSPYNADSTLYPVIQHLNLAAGFAAEDSADRRLDKLEALLKRASDNIGETAPLVAVLLGIDAEARYGAMTLSPQQRRNRTLAALVDQLVALAAHKPVLWVIEDAHWIDPTTLELIELTLDRIQGTRVLLLITTRPTFAASFASHPVVTRLALNRLARAATQAIVLRITNGKRLPDVLLDEIAARTDGVPLFVEEMTKAVIESGVLVEEDDSYRLDGPLSALAIPTTLHDSLMSRLDRLQPVKEVAQMASVIGRGFDHGTISALAGLPERELVNAMQKLVDAELVFRRGTPPDASYLFKHALVRDAAYESLLKAKRIALHARLLDILEKGDAAPELKAQHAEAAGLTARALDYWEQAGRQAVARPAYKEAVASFENAIRVCRLLGIAEQWKRREHSLQHQLGQALQPNQGYSAPATLHAFQRALELADEVGDPTLQLQALFGLWVGSYVSGRYSGLLAERFSALAESQQESGPRLVGRRMLALGLFHQGRFKESLSEVTVALNAYDPNVHHNLAHRYGHDPRVAAGTVAAYNLWYLGLPDQADRRAEESLQWARQINHANTTGYALCYGVAVLNIWLRRPILVENAARETLRLAEELSLPLWHAWSRIQLGWALSQAEAAAGLDEIEAGLAEAKQLGFGRLAPLNLSFMAEMYSRAGRLDDARQSIANAFAALEHSQDQAFTAELHRVRAMLTLQACISERSAAETDLRQALEIARIQKSPMLQLRAARDLACILAERGKRQQAIETLAPIFSWFGEGFGMPDLMEAKSLLDELAA